MKEIKNPMKKIVFVFVAFLLILIGTIFGLNIFKSKQNIDSKIDNLPTVVEKPGPNVLLISLDTLGAKHLHCYGYHRQTSPNIDKLASEGILFSQATNTAPWTTPSHMSVFTSLYPSVHGVTSTKNKLDENRITLAEILRGDGYTTAAFISSPVMLPFELGFGQGFDVYDDYTVTFDQEANLFLLNDEFRGQNDHPICPITHNMVVPWLDRNYQKKFFLFVHYWDIHGDYAPPSPYDTMFDPEYQGKFNGDQSHIDLIKPGIAEPDLKHMIALYDGEIGYVDSHLGMLFDKFKELGLMDETIIILMADHGEEFLEHGGNWHGKTMYDEVTHVPLIIRFPALINESKVLQNQVSLVDIMPTISDMLEIPIKHPIQGRSLLPLIKQEECPNLEAYSDADTSGRDLKSIRTGKFKFIYSCKNKEEELYDLVNDPMELNNLVEIKPELTKVLREQLFSWMESSGTLAGSLPNSGASQEIEYDRKLDEKLKSLGYLQ